MARFLIGVMGDAWGHVLEARALHAALPGHQIWFVGGERAGSLADLGCALEPVPVAATRYVENRVDVAATVRAALGAFAALPEAIGRITALIRRIAPDLVISLYELVTPLAARRAGVPCVSLDHQHVVSHATIEPSPHTFERWSMELSLRLIYDRAPRRLIHSFFPATPRDPETTECFPPLLAPELAQLAPQRGIHRLVYQTSSTFERLLPALTADGRDTVIYGMGERPATGALRFRGFSRQRFLEDLSTCRYLVGNGGHTALSEALFLGKPVLSFPIRGAHEQQVNARALARLGYGDLCVSPTPDPDILARFEARLPEFEAALAGGDFHGTARVARRLVELATRHTTAPRDPDGRTPCGR